MVTIKLPVPGHNSVVADIGESDVNFIVLSEPNDYDFFYSAAMTEFAKVYILVSRTDSVSFIKRNGYTYLNISGLENDSAASIVMEFLEGELSYYEALKYVLHRMYVDGMCKHLFPKHILDFNGERMVKALQSIEDLGLGLGFDQLWETEVGDNGIEFIMEDDDMYDYEDYLLYPFVFPKDGCVYISIPHSGTHYDGPNKTVKKVYEFFKCETPYTTYSAIEYCFSVLAKTELENEQVIALNVMCDGKQFCKEHLVELALLFGCKFYSVANSPNGLFIPSDYIVGKETAVLVLRFVIAELSLDEGSTEEIKAAIDGIKAECERKKKKISVPSGTPVIKALYEKTVFPFNL